MQKIGLLLLVLLSFRSSAQDYGSLKRAIGLLDEALIEKDTVVLNRLLHPKLVYGHSNGWIQRRPDVNTDLYNGRITYNRITRNAMEISTEGPAASVKTRIQVNGVVDGKPFDVSLQVLQVWIWDRGTWWLFCRQGVKI